MTVCLLDQDLVRLVPQQSHLSCQPTFRNCSEDSRLLTERTRALGCVADNSHLHINLPRKFAQGSDGVGDSLFFDK